MKRLARFAPLLALLAVAVITVITLRSRGAWRAWQPLPGGGEVRMTAVTHGTEHSVELDRVSWRKRVRTAWLSRSWQPLTSRPNSWARARTRTPSLVFWLEGRNLPRRAPNPNNPNLVVGRELGSIALVLPDGQAFHSGTSRMSRVDLTTALWEVHFPLLPARSRTLRLITSLDGARQEFVVPNPAYRTDLPVWKADPLPQTKRHGDAAFTLHRVNVSAIEGDQPNGGALRFWHAQADWTIAHRGGRGDTFYEIKTVFGDPAGNVSPECGLFSEPVWKVRATISRTDRFPFRDDEVRWLGTIDPAVPEASMPRAYALLPLADFRSGGRFTLVGVFGPGQFEIQHGAVISSAPANAAEPGDVTEWDGSRAVYIVRLEKAAVVIIEDLALVARSGWQEEIGAERLVPRVADPFPVLEASVGIPVFQDEKGAAAELLERSGGFPNRTSIRAFHLPPKPLRFGLAKRDPTQLEFLIPAPARP